MTCTKTKFGRILLALAAPVLAGTSAAHAGLNVFTNPGSPTGTGPYTYTYDISIPAGETITTGSLFRIYDVGGFTGASATPAGWSLTTSFTDPAPPVNVNLTLGDDPTITNLTYTYTGSTVAGPSTLNGFAINSTFGSTGLKNYISRDTSTIAGAAPLFVDSVGPIAVPVPEPMLAGVFAVGTVGMLRRRRSN